MNLKPGIAGLITLVFLSVVPANSLARGDGFNDVVKSIERFYHVKHQDLPLLARAGMKAARTAGRIRGGEYKRLAEAGSLRIAFFEDQTFDSRGKIATFKSTIRQSLEENWSAVVQTLAPGSEEQNYVFLREAGNKFQVLVVNIERHDATVIEATLAPDVLAELMKDPEAMGKALTDEAAINDN
jgi:hypothetical protein